MISWLKFYFLGFFNDTYGKEAASRSFLNVILSLILAVILFSGGITAGYVASFGTHYDNADEFRKFMYSAFASDNESRIGLKIKNGKLSADIPDGQSINGFIDGEWTVGGYRLVVDTNPASTAFDDFTLVCKNASGEEISYEEYRGLPAADRKKCSVAFQYSGRPLDVTVKQAEYTAYLDKLSDPNDDEYNSSVATAYGELNHKKSSGEVSEKDYAVQVYILYARSYYPSFASVESYGKAPTLRTYYIRLGSMESDEKYLILLDDTCIGSFKTSKGISVNFCSYYSGVADSVITADGMSADKMRANIDGFMEDCFSGSGGTMFLVYLISAFKLLLAVIAIMLVLALLVFAVGKIFKIKTGSKLFDSLKILGAYLLYSALAAFIMAFILSFFVERATVYLATQIVFVSVFVARATILYIMEIIKEKRRKKFDDELDDFAP